jgi:hypothetical protein
MKYPCPHIHPLSQYSKACEENHFQKYLQLPPIHQSFSMNLWWFMKQLFEFEITTYDHFGGIHQM